MKNVLIDLAVVILPFLLSIVGVYVSMETPKKHLWWWRIGLLLLGLSVTGLTYSQQQRLRKEVVVERKQHDLEQGALEGKLTLMSDVMAKSSCPSTAEIGAAVQQELAKQGYRRARIPIAEGQLASLSGDSLIKIVPYVSEQLREFRALGWGGEDDNIEKKSWAGS